MRLALIAAPPLTASGRTNNSQEVVLSRIESENRRTVAAVCDRARYAESYERFGRMAERFVRVFGMAWFLAGQSDHLVKLLEQVRVLLGRGSDQTQLITSLAAQAVEISRANNALMRDIHARLHAGPHDDRSNASRHDRRERRAKMLVDVVVFVVTITFAAFGWWALEHLE